MLQLGRKHVANNATRARNTMAPCPILPDAVNRPARLVDLLARANDSVDLLVIPSQFTRSHGSFEYQCREQSMRPVPFCRCSFEVEIGILNQVLLIQS